MIDAILRPPRVSPSRRGAPLLLLALLAAVVSCSKEKPAAETAAAPEGTPAPAQAEKVLPERKPTILSKPASDLAPFFGLRGPRGICLDEKGRLWVANFGDSEIRIFDLSGGYFGGWGNRGTLKTQFRDPSGVAVKGDDVYIADTWNGRVVQFSSTGKWKAQAPGDFYGPRGIAVAPDGKVWVVDTGNQRLVVLDRDLTNPRRFGKKGSGAEEFSSPVGIAIDSEGNAYIADADNRRIAVVDPQGRFKARWKVSGWGPNTEPYVAVDGDGTVYATDSVAREVFAWNKHGEVRRWTEDDAGKKFARPTGIALDSKARVLYVVNTDPGTIVTLKLSSKAGKS
jgi:sugar lactone lactonase YvrE